MGDTSGSVDVYTLDSGGLLLLLQFAVPCARWLLPGK
jgi:hypothetical protein